MNNHWDTRHLQIVFCLNSPSILENRHIHLHCSSIFDGNEGSCIFCRLEKSFLKSSLRGTCISCLYGQRPNSCLSSKLHLCRCKIDGIPELLDLEGNRFRGGDILRWFLCSCLRQRESFLGFLLSYSKDWWTALWLSDPWVLHLHNTWARSMSWDFRWRFWRLRRNLSRAKTGWTLCLQG